MSAQTSRARAIPSHTTAAAATGICALALLVPWLRIAAGVGITLVLPGWSVIAVVDARRRVDRAAWMVGIPTASLGVVVLAGLLLNVAASLRPATWDAALVLFCIACQATAAVLRKPSLRRAATRARGRPRPLVAVLVALAGLVALGSVAVSVRSARHADARQGVVSLSLTKLAPDRVAVRADCVACGRRRIEVEVTTAAVRHRYAALVSVARPFGVEVAVDPDGWPVSATATTRGRLLASARLPGSRPKSPDGSGR